MPKPKDLIAFSKPQGFVRMFTADDDGVPRKMIAAPNLVVYSGADVMAGCLGWKQNYIPKAMYFEFENTTGTPSYPAIARDDDDLSYYTGLSTPKDYIRVPISVNPSFRSTDGTKYEANAVTFFAITGATQGEHGVAFGAASNSKVYGAALVATPDVSDSSKDIIVSRIYPPDILIVAKGDSQLGLQWEVICK